MSARPILIMAGGTGGHVFPALALARLLQRHSCGVLWLGIQTFINVGVNMGVLPTKGLTLPLMSYGRSSLIVTLTWVGLLLRVYHEAATWHETGSRMHGARRLDDDTDEEPA